MKWRLVIGIVLLGLLSCRRQVDLPEAQAELCIHVNLPQASLPVKAEGEVLPELAAETAISDLKIWVFRNDNHSLLGYIHPSKEKHMQSAWEDRYFIKIPASVALEHPNVDVYALANSEGLGLENLDENTSPAQLEALSVGGEVFGVKSDGTPACKGVPEGGLPFSAVGKNLQMSGDYPSMTVETVTLQRMVSKFRLVLCQLADNQGPVVQFTISELSLDESLLSAQEYVFNDSANPYKTGGDYVPGKVLFPIRVQTEIASSADPQSYAWREGQSAQAFESQILEGIQNGELTQLGPYYFRETDKRLTGRIGYSIMGGEPQELRFTMSSGDSFTRNRSWTVYLYFMSTEMAFSCSIQPWDKEEDGYQLIVR